RAPCRRWAPRSARRCGSLNARRRAASRAGARCAPASCGHGGYGHPSCSSMDLCSRLLLLRLFDDHALADIAHTLALVRLRRPRRADLRRDLAYLLLVDALDHDLGLLRRLALHALWHRVHDWMREAERQVDLVAGRLRPVADA